jgi:predicted O-methyltransferase YrrM
MVKADEVLREIEERAKHEFLPIIGPGKGRILAKTIRDVKPKKVLEVGTLIGYSAILIGKELGKNVHIISIEIHPDEAKTAEENVKRAGIRPRVEIIVGNALDILPKIHGLFDAVFIDAEKTEYMEYLRLVEKNLHKGTVIVADNAGIFADQMKDYLTYVRTSGKYNSKYVSMGEDGLEISVKT